MIHIKLSLSSQEVKRSTLTLLGGWGEHFRGFQPAYFSGFPEYFVICIFVCKYIGGVRLYLLLAFSGIYAN